MMQLTPKQEAFCQAWIQTGNASAAYRRVYSAVNMKPATIHVKACNLLEVDKVAVRVDRLQSEARERHIVTVESIARQLDEARDLAMRQGRAAAAVSATLNKARLYGLL